MKLIKSVPRYKCDFCNHRAPMAAMIKHEKRCYKNPNRYCDYCDNDGFTMDVDNNIAHQEPCPYCAKMNPIEPKKEVLPEVHEICNIPF